MGKGVEGLIEMGEKRGMEKGFERGITLARNVFIKYGSGISESQIAEECGLSVERVLEILGKAG